MEAKWKKPIANRDRAVADVASYNQLIEEAIERKSRTVKLDRFVDECTKAFHSAVEFNQSLVQLASGAENASQLVPPLESWLEEFVQNHDDRMQYYKTARAAAPPSVASASKKSNRGEYLRELPHTTDDSLSGKGSAKKGPVSVSRSGRAASKPSCHSNIEASSQVASLTPSQRKLEQRLAKLRREEAERKAEAEFSLARQKADLARQQTDLQANLDIRIAEENQRQIVAQARIEEAVYDSADESDWGSIQPRPLFASLIGSNEARTNEWVRTGGNEPQRTSPTSNLGTGGEVNQPQPISSLPVVVPPSVASVVYAPTEPVSQIEPVFPQTTSFFVPWSNPIEQGPSTPTLTQPQPSIFEPLENSNVVPPIAAAFPNFQMPVHQQPVVTSLTSHLSNAIASPAAHVAPTGPKFQFSAPLENVPSQVQAPVPSNVNIGGTAFYAPASTMWAPTMPNLVPRPSVLQHATNPGVPIFPNHVPTSSVHQPASNLNFAAPCLQTPSQNGNGLSPADVAKLIAATRKEPLPEWKLPEFSGDPLQWPEWFGQFKSAVDSATWTDAAKTTYLKTLVTGKAKAVIEGFAYCGDMYQEALKALERKYGQPQTVVSAHLEKLGSWPSVKMHNSESLIAYAIVISSLVGVFKSLGFDADLRSSTLLMQAVSKLPPNLKEAWAMYTVKRNFSRPTLNEFNEWLQQKSEAHDRMQAMPSGRSKLDQEGKAKNASRAYPSATQGRPQSSSTGQRTQKTTLQPTTREPCANCQGPHPIFRCPGFLKMTATERAKLVAEKGSCFSCLGNGHGFRQCTRNMKCPNDGCNSSHNRLLHGAERVYPRRTSEQRMSTSGGANKQGASEPNRTTALMNSNLIENNVETTSMPATVKGLLQIVKVEVAAPSKSIQVMALCDTGCTHSWITSRLANELTLEGEPTKLTVKGFNSKREIRTAQVNITLRSVDLKSSVEFAVRPFTKDDLGVGSDEIDLEALKRKFPHLTVVPGNRISYSDVELILGQDIYEAIRPIEYVKPPGKNVPMAVLLPLGWVTSGPVDSATAFLSSMFKVSCTTADQDLTEEVRRWYDIESFGTLKDVTPRSKADAKATEILERTTRHDGERYEVGMLWAEENSSLPNNFFSALAQLKSLERRLEKDDDLKQKYAATIADDFSKGYIEQVDPKNDTVKSTREWYLPHHPIIHPNKPGKVRRVLNGAANFRGHSLNKSLLTGPDLLQNLVSISLRFRRHAFAVSADIEAMFLQVGVPESDRPSIRFLWREDPNSELVVYQYTRHIFGAKDSPTCANYALRRTAEDNRNEHPEIVSIVEKNFYMDDYLDSCPSKTESLQRSRELTCLLQKGGFKLTKFVGNFPELEQIEPPVDSKESLHVLGLEWNHKQDTLVVSRGTRKPVKEPITQRTILSCVASVFDPIGLVAPYTVKARLILKDIWRTSGQNWDAPLPTEMTQEFLSWSDALPLLNDIQIKRPYFESEPDEVELHVFGDSSRLAFGAVVFLRGRLTEVNGSWKTQLAFVFGKGRVAPNESTFSSEAGVTSCLTCSQTEVRCVRRT